MVKLNTQHLLQCIKTLDSSLERLSASKPDSIDYEVFRNATVKEFELTLETAGKLLRKTLKDYSGNPRSVDELNYKDLFRHAHKHGLLETPAVERWFAYRDNRNNTSHDYGIAFAKKHPQITAKIFRGLEGIAKNTRHTFRALIVLDLDPRYIALIKKILAQHVPDKTVWVYGSRIKGTAHPGSDLDLVVIDPNEDSSPQINLSALREAFSESDLPILIDVFNWSDIPDAFKNEIESIHEILQGS